MKTVVRILSITISLGFMFLSLGSLANSPDRALKQIYKPVPALKMKQDPIKKALKFTNPVVLKPINK